MPQLYHASANEIKGEYLIPQLMEDLTMKVYLSVYASHKLPAVYAYALKSADKNVCEWQTHWEVNDNPFVVLKHRERLAGQQLGKIYPVEGDFRNVRLWDGSETCEWTATTPVKVDVQNAIKPQSVDEILKQGVQVFFLDDSITQKEWHKVLHDISLGFAEEKNFYGVVLEPVKPARTPAEYGQRYLQLTRQMVESGLMVHENAERDISPVNLYTGNFHNQTRNWAESIAALAQNKNQGPTFP